MPLLTRSSTDRTSQPSLRPAEVIVAVGAFLFLCLAVLTKSASMLEPDDFAYRASIVALSQGHLVLTNAQYLSLSHQLGSILQWDHLANGHWFSEKNPGYPFFAVPFYMAHMLRVAPLFYGALASVALFLGARRWLGAWGGTWAAGLFCTSGAAMSFAWRSTMPTFTDASFVAIGAGLLLWTLLATDASSRRRTVVGALALVALFAAMFIRYTDVVALAVAVLAIVATARWTGLRRLTYAWWGGLTILLLAGDMWFNTYFYGGAFSTGYSAGEITFSLSSFWPNLTGMPSSLLQAMPMTLLALVTLVWLTSRAWRARRELRHGSDLQRVRVDVMVATFVGLAWAGIWGLYACYSWTVNQQGNSIHVIRFYLPALGLIALLGAWCLQQLPRWAALVLLAGVGLDGLYVFHSITANSGLGGPGGSGGPGGRIGPGGAGNYGPPPGGTGNYGPPPGGSGNYGPPNGIGGPGGSTSALR